MNAESQTKRVRHILSLSGGKDSTALAVYMRDRLPEVEYVFCDTGKELPETYEYMDKIEQFLGKRVVRLKSDIGFDHWLRVFRGFLPSARVRWCTRELKIKPFEKYVGQDTVYSYLGIRADEQREGYISSKPNIIPKYPFKEAGITKKDVYRILEEAGLGLPKYYEWRSRSGCYFCFFQQRIEWVGLKERHPEYYEKAKHYEEVAAGQMRSNYSTASENPVIFTWNPNLSLVQLEQNAEKIKENHHKALARRQAKEQKKSLFEIFHDEINEEQDERACLICEL